ncbi:hypothetical protein O0555_20935 [Brevibacillus laterosporus]|uniref:hypothetical protein n=1 Tax=Brevibacillus laterosporus TaxID=1465 RepID=UPI001443A51D|nr:hypothetical protein [Brevibacillus laterosporus]MCR8939768.1 hypothetical protein [Brevibacillus laterosporus]MCZ0842408.1 hypothetical protein [Brevibacillus laterosporus]MCZ0846405.1 hypothetical protein [Brevibacillus laterosporus]MED1666086.1 hypothetical protein [Brevibacillus laterosporus]MED1670305.1 hypothetical protein [Brevibacillus laterosporus]
MKLFKSTVVAVALVAGLSTFSVGVSASENQQVKPKSVSLQTDTSSQDLRMSYELKRLMRETKTKEFYVDSKTDVTFTLLQWRGDGYRDGYPNVTYKLMNPNGEISVKEVYGQITNEGDFKITFPNLSGTYYIHIINNSDFPVSGFGYVEY